VAPEALQQSLRQLIDEYRARCLWFVRADYYPQSVAEQLRVLDAIERYGDRPGFQRAAQLKKWLSLPSSELSASS
jgi:hypothetical protein